MKSSSDLTNIWTFHDAEALLKLAKELNLNGEWRAHLSLLEQTFFQYVLFEGKNTWENFLEGKVSSNLIDTFKNTLSNLDLQSDNIFNGPPNTENAVNSCSYNFKNHPSTNNFEISSSLNNNCLKYQPDFINSYKKDTNSMNLNNNNPNPTKLKKILDQFDSMLLDVNFNSLAFKVRRILYEKSIPFLFDSGLNLFESNIDIDLLTENNDTNKQDSTSDAIQTRKMDVDEDYDDDYDDDDNENDANDQKKNNEINDNLKSNDKNNNDKFNDKENGISNNNNNVVLNLNTQNKNDKKANGNNNQNSNQKELSLLLSKLKYDLTHPNPKEVELEEKAALHDLPSVYHLFENDKKALKSYLRTKENQLNQNKSDADNISNPMNFGAANLSLKNLLLKIKKNRSRLGLSDSELRNLVLDVRKNRSKWASEEKIGQEELYEAAEKVVLDLRAHTVHSTAFLNKVSRRDAPNYYNVIKNPMDLGTVMKKLKAFQYKSKQEFVDDLMLIWKNCLTYNADPSHFLRIHALAMKKKTLSLVPLIPNITIRDRQEIESREGIMSPMDVNQNEDSEYDSENEFSLTRKGFNLNKNNKKRKFTSDEPIYNSGSPAPTNKDILTHPNGSLLDDTVTNNNYNNRTVVNNNFESRESSTIPVSTENIRQGDFLMFKSTENLSDPMNNNNQSNLKQNKNMNFSDVEDIETLFWKKLTLYKRGEFLLNRKTLFKGFGLNDASPAIIRTSGSMSKFIKNEMDFYKLDGTTSQDFQETTSSASLNNNTLALNGTNTKFSNEKIVDSKSNLQLTSDQDLSIHKNNKNKVMDTTTTSKKIQTSFYDDLYYDQEKETYTANDVEKTNEIEKNSNNNDFDDFNKEKDNDIHQKSKDSIFLQEYEVSSGVPELPMKVAAMYNDPDHPFEVPDDLKLEDVRSSAYIPHRPGMVTLIDNNLREMQEIRQICSKIILIRQIQTQPFYYGRDAESIVEPLELEESDVDLESRIDPFRANVVSPIVCRAAMKRCLGKVVMLTGFEQCQAAAMEAIGEIAGEYLTNLGRTLMNYYCHSIDGRPRYSNRECILHALYDNGIESLNSLDNYINDMKNRTRSKLCEIKQKMKEELAEQLRPAISELNDTMFTDGSEQFITGDFAEDTGDDFFGFKELGIDKELNLVNLTVPMHLLHGKLASMSMNNIPSIVSKSEEEYPTPKPYDKLTYAESKKVIGLLRPFYEKKFEVLAKKEANSKSNKDASLQLNQELSNGLKNHINPNLALPDDDDLSAKLKYNNRTKVPPTGKLTQIKKRTKDQTFFKKGPGSTLPPDLNNFLNKDQTQTIETNTLQPNGTVILKESL